VTLGDLIVMIGSDNRKLDEGLAKAIDSVDRASARIGSAGKAMTMGVTAPLVALAGAGFKFANDFNRGMANVGTLIPGNTERVQELGKAIQKMSMESGKATDDLTDGMYNVISAFGDSADTVKILELNMRAAVGGMSTTQDAINLTSAVTKAYGDTSYEAQKRAADLALMTVRLGQTTFPELASSIQRVTAVGSALGVSQEELFASFATFTGVTGGAAEVSTQLNAALRALNKPTEGLAKAMKRAGIESGAALVAQRGLGGALKFIGEEARKAGSSIQEFTGRGEAATLITALLGGLSDDYVNKLGQMAGELDTTNDAFREHSEGIGKTAFEWDKFKAAITVALQNVGQAVMVMMPALIGITGAIAGLTMWFSELSAPLQTTIVAFGAFLAAIGPVLLIVSKVLAAKVALSSVAVGLGVSIGALVLPVVAAVAALVAIGVAVYQVVKHWDTLKASTVALAGAVKSYLGESGVGGTLGSLGRLLMSIGQAWWALQRLVAAVVVKIATAVGQHLWKNIQKDMDNIMGVLRAVGGVFDWLWGLIKRFVSFIVRDFKQGLTDAFSTLSGWADKATAVFSTMYDKVVGNSYVPDMVKRIGEEFKTLNTLMVEPAKAATTSVERAFAAMSMSKTGAADITSRYASAIGQLRSQKFSLMMEKDAEAAAKLREQIRGTEAEIRKLGAAVAALGGVKIELKMATPKEEKKKTVLPFDRLPEVQTLRLVAGQIGQSAQHTMSAMDVFRMSIEDTNGSWTHMAAGLDHNSYLLYEFGQGLNRAGIVANDFAVPLDATSVSLHAMSQVLAGLPDQLKGFGSSLLSAMKVARDGGGSIWGALAGGVISGGTSMLIGAGINALTKSVTSLFSRKSKSDLVPAVRSAASRINDLGSAASAAAGALNAPSGYRYEPLRLHEAQTARVGAPARQEVVHNHYYSNRFDIDVNARERPVGEMYEEWMREARRRSAANFGTEEAWGSL
jgi:TP901 family phage tail tape measure protein